MKRFLLLFIVSTICGMLYSQLKYNGYPCGIDNTRYLVMNRWNKTSLTYYIYNSSNSLTAIERTNAIKNAFDTWEANSVLHFSQVYSPDSADLKISWISELDHGDGLVFGTNTLAHAFYPPVYGGDYAGQLHFNDNYSFRVNGTTPDLESTALHEIGHLIGIAHSSYSSSVMYYLVYYRRNLTIDDCMAAWALYGCPFSINGNYLVNSGENYYINWDLPNDVTITWSINNSSFLLTPSGTQCTVTCNQNNANSNAILTATISLNGQSVSIQKEIVHAGEIAGNEVIDSISSYEIMDLPEDYDITWSINQSGFSISSNHNHCAVTCMSNNSCIEAVLTANIFKDEQLIKTITKTIYHVGEIVTGSFVRNNASYSLLNLPNTLNTIWSVDNPAFSLSTNGSQCTVTLPNSYQEGTLTATVSKNGQILKTLTKSLLSHSSSLSVSGTQHDYMTLGATYLGHTFNVNASNAVNGYSSTNIEVNGDCSITLLSDRFKGMNISFIGTKQPIYVSHNENEVYFHLQSCFDDYIGEIPVDRSNDNRGVNIVEPSYSLILRAQCEGGYYDFDLNFHVIPMHGVCDETNSTLIIDLVGSTLYVTLSDAEVPVWGGQYQQLPWYLTIVNAATGSIVYTQNVLGMSTSVNVGSLSSGLYIVRGTLNGNVYSAKFFN